MQPARQRRSRCRRRRRWISTGVACIPKKKYKGRISSWALTRRERRKKWREYDGTGQCDTLQVLVLDETNHTYTSLPINRDTMTDVKSLDDDRDLSGDNPYCRSLWRMRRETVWRQAVKILWDAVSNLLYGQTIDGYASLNMDAIEVLQSSGRRRDGHDRGRFFKGRSYAHDGRDSDSHGRTGDALRPRADECRRRKQ